MSATDRQNRLIVAEDWKKIYQSFKNADFQSYDFETLRRTMITYIRQNYPEDFNDYIESSEYLALIDVIAFLGQSISFRSDLNARENFLELADRRDSILRLSRLIGYNAKRNIAANGLLKFTSVQTSQEILDSNGRNLANQVISWNDSSNANWYEQFIKVMNAAMSSSQQFGNPSDKATIYGIPTERYTFESSNTGVPVYGFSKTISGRLTNFEVTSTTFSGKSYIYEETPKLGRKLSCIFRDDGHGYGSSSSGFFLNFTQGSLNSGTFTVSQPSKNESVDVGSPGVNNTDVWLYRLDKNGAEAAEWVQVPSFEGNNIIYNSLNKNIKDIFSVSTRAGDAITLKFSDGTFGSIPLGIFRVYYRLSNGLSYTINPKDIRNITITVPYTSNVGQTETLTISLALTYSVTNAETTETNDSIKTNAPATYYTQNRMITGEDYNICPLSVNQQVLKVKAVNRTASGISRYFDLVDPTGKYSSTNLFADDCILYKEDYNSFAKFSYTSKTSIEGEIANTITKIIRSPQLRNFYYSNFVSYITESLSVKWNTVTLDFNSSSGYVNSTMDNVIFKVGTYTETDLKYFREGALIKFTCPEGLHFDTKNRNAFVEGTGITDPAAIDYIWATVVSVSADGTAQGKGTLANGTGPITLNIPIPSGAIVSQIIPKFRTSIDASVVTSMIDLIYENKPFGLRYNTTQQAWQIIFEPNLDFQSQFSLGNQGNTNNKHQDASWLLLFTTDNEFYTVNSRETRFIFESDNQIRFYFDSNEHVYNSRSSALVRDKISILNVNTVPDSTYPFTRNIDWEITSEYIGLDGYVDNKKIVITFADSDDNGVVDDPELFIKLVNPSVNSTNKYIVQERYLIAQGQEDYRYIDNTDNIVSIQETETSNFNAVNGQYYYFIDTNIVKKGTVYGTLVSTLDYKVYLGRDKLKCQYIHNANYNSRIDPGASNIIDVYVLSKSYDTVFRQWINGANIDKPLPPSSDELFNTLAPSLNLIKSVSDEVIYHPIGYKVLFGQSAALELQAIFKVTKTPGQVISDNDIKSRIIISINKFFELDNWDFGDTFYFTELATYVMTESAPYISNFVIVPRHSGLNFGSLFEIKTQSNQLLISSATVNDIEIISGITPSNIKTVNGVINNTSLQQSITSSSYGSI